MITFQGVSYYEAPTAQMLREHLEAKRQADPYVLFTIQPEPGADVFGQGASAYLLDGKEATTLRKKLGYSTHVIRTAEAVQKQLQGDAIRRWGHEQWATQLDKAIRGTALLADALKGNVKLWTLRMTDDGPVKAVPAKRINGYDGPMLVPVSESADTKEG